YRSDCLELTSSKESVLARIHADHSKLAYLLEALARHRQLEFSVEVYGSRRVLGDGAVVAPAPERLISHLLVADHRRRLDLFHDRTSGRARHQKHQAGMRKRDRGL